MQAGWSERTIPSRLVALQRPAWKKLYPVESGPPSTKFLKAQTADPSITIISKACYNEDF